MYYSDIFTNEGWCENRPRESLSVGISIEAYLIAEKQCDAVENVELMLGDANDDAIAEGILLKYVY